jgi:hypothetical protein
MFLHGDLRCHQTTKDAAAFICSTSACLIVLRINGSASVLRDSMSKASLHLFAAIFASSLYRRARHIAIGTEHAAITRLWFEQDIAAGTLVEPLAGIRRHGQQFRMTALRAGQQGFKLQFHSF